MMSYALAPNGGRFSCGGPIPPQSQQKYSAASYKECRSTRSPGFPSAVSYKRWLGRSFEPMLVHGCQELLVQLHRWRRKD